MVIIGGGCIGLEVTASGVSRGASVIVRLDHLPLARYHFRCPGHVLAELAQTIAATALARRQLDHQSFAR